MMTSPINLHRDRLLEQYHRLENSLRMEVMPAFRDIEGQLCAYSKKLDEHTFVSDEPSFQEGEHKAVLCALFGDDLRSSQSDMAAFAIVALYHQWERSVKWLIAKKDETICLKKVQNANFDDIKSTLDFDNLPVECRETFEKLNLGRLIANVIKHGSGSSAEELQKKKPEFFSRPGGDKDFDLPSDQSTNLIWVQKADVDEVANAICCFWETLPADYFPPFDLTLKSFMENYATPDSRC